MAQILLAEDDASTRQIVQAALESDGHKVHVVSNGGEALEVLKSSVSIDILVSDVDMPELDGVSLAQTVAADHPGVPVVLLSGHQTELDRASKVLGGANFQALAKPVSIDALRAAVKQMT